MPRLSKPERDRNEIARLESKHDLYTVYKAKWDFFLSSYEGGEDFASKDNLFQHTREHNEDFEERAKRIYYENEVAPIVDFFTEFIFQETIQRDAGKSEKFYNDFITNVNKKGEDVSTFMAEVCTDMQIYGMLYILVDAPVLPADRLVTKRDEQRLGLRPYWVLIPPQEILDWVTDAFGNYTYLKRYQLLSEFDPATASVQRIEKYTEWTAQEIKVTEVDISASVKNIKNQTTFPNNLKEIPVEVVRFRKSKKDPEMGASFLVNLAGAARELLNLTSMQQEFLYRQCFNILAMEGEEQLPFKEQEEGDSGTSNALIYPRGAHMPQYIAPSAEPADKMSEAKDRVLQYMYRIAAQNVMNEIVNGGKASGFAKAQSFNTSVPKIATRAEILETTENRLMRLTMKFMRQEWKGSVKYKDRYEITNITDWLTQLAMLFTDLGMPMLSETFAKEQMKKAAMTFDGKWSPEKLQTILDEIDRADLTKWFKKIGPQEKEQKQSVAAQQKSKQSTQTSSELKAESEKNNTTKVTKKTKPSTEK